ncbi:hypothetical protein [Aquimarina intermedia]|uniref:DUF1579 domain-containing protein n=1 Tax=Aquimarina intermedia TaxID=350814 RepID=A0A5S5BTA8_9FLAO|nr:hypothetical protein [Aquimarina intermedia]TYP70411.1 hypothetical protein BD809_1123 [Aquimarina intermedia]
MLRFTAYLVFLLISNASFSQETSIQKERQFDFWIGDWEVYTFQTDSLVGKSKITSILNGKGIKEEYASINTSYQGTSLNTYNSKREHWEQYYIDITGLVLHLYGGFKENTMCLMNQVVMEEGMLLNRITWQPLDHEEVRQRWTQSSDNGKTWIVIFDGRYRKTQL